MLKIFNEVFLSHQVCTGFDTLPLKEKMLNNCGNLPTFYTAIENLREKFLGKKERYSVKSPITIIFCKYILMCLLLLKYKSLAEILYK